MYLRRTTIIHMRTTIIYIHNIGARGFVGIKGRPCNWGRRAQVRQCQKRPSTEAKETYKIQHLNSLSLYSIIPPPSTLW
jgi:hypothetical protein